jgi:hypothetical protein
MLDRLERLVADATGVGRERGDGVEHHLIEAGRLLGRHVRAVRVVGAGSDGDVGAGAVADSLIVIWVTMPDASCPGTSHTSS